MTDGFPSDGRLLVFVLAIRRHSLYSAGKILRFTPSMNKDINSDMLKTVCDFLELGHVENIIAMFKEDKSLYGLTGDLLRDERFKVRLGTAVLFEELASIRPADISLAVSSLLPLLQEGNPILRGEAATILGIIGSSEAAAHLEKLANDPDTQVREIIRDILHHESDT